MACRTIHATKMKRTVKSTIILIVNFINVAPFRKADSMSGWKSRQVLFRENKSKEWAWPTDEHDEPWQTFTAHGKQELTDSQGHPYRLLGKTDSDIGGSFGTVKHFYSEWNNMPEVIHSWPYPHAGGYHFRGKGQYAAVATVGYGNFPEAQISSNNELDVLGTQIIANILPTNPVAGLAVAIGEIREGLPSIVGSSAFKHRLARARSAGDEYLNVEFGWKPLLSDLRAFSDAITKEETLLRQYIRNSGRRIKRRVSLPETIEVSTEYKKGIAQPILSTPLYWQPEGDLEIITTVKRKQWFSGCFTYYVGDPRTTDVNLRNAALRNKLYGDRVTPEVIWDLTPWSWAADWFADTGAVLHNIGAFLNDGLVMPYAYVMETTSVTKEYILKNVQYANTDGPSAMGQTFTTESKVRRRATPFGFGLTPGDLNARQIAILAALGLTLL